MAQTTKVILLEGNPKKPESAEHIIKFPGGSISVCRTANNEYWAHIEVNHGQVLEEIGVRESKRGDVVDSRIDYDTGLIGEMPYMPVINHVAVRITTSQGYKSAKEK
jgi:hypothetical protein